MHDPLLDLHYLHHPPVDRPRALRQVTQAALSLPVAKDQFWIAPTPDAYRDFDNLVVNTPLQKLSLAGPQSAPSFPLPALILPAKASALLGSSP